MNNNNINQSKKNGKHLVLDLDESLVHTFSPEDGFSMFVKNMSPEQEKRLYILDFENGEALAGYIRPYIEVFLETAFNEFETVSVWSAGTQAYVHGIVDLIFKTNKPYFVLTRKDCNEMKLGYDNSTCRYKPLEIIYKNYPTHKEENTIIVDDRHDICALNCLNNIQVPEFMMTHLNWKSLVEDDTLKILTDWIKSEEFRNAKDVRLLKSKSPFKI